MESMSPQQQQDGLSRGSGQQENKWRLKSQSYRRQSAPSLVITKALTRSKTLSRESFSVPVCPETCSLVQSFLTSSDRLFLLHGHAQLKTGMQTQDRHLFLFNDILVIAKAKSANNFKQKDQARVCEMWTASCMDEVCEGSTNPEWSFVLGWPTCNCVTTFSSAEQKERWLSLLKSRIKEEKEKEEPKTIPLRVYGKGINTFAVAKTLPVSNSDSTNEVIRLALQQFGIIGNVKDFQLWVISKRDNAPYPLIGHECPFSIQMSHVRPSTSRGGGGSRDTAAPPADKQKAVLEEQVYRQCQFILKPRPIEMPQQHISAELSQKSLKRRRSLMAWAFWRGCSSHLNELSLASGARGCLFGHPLSAVCLENALPKPVMDMLRFLYHEGSWTRGIFRRPAGARAVRELRDSLDTGGFQLPLTRDHVFIIAGVFKDFLRSIPGSLLCCELHEEWMDVLEEEEYEEEQVQDVKRMICRLPKENALLLRYLLAVLHGIQGNAHENQMTSFNLSVCIAPSILWPPGAPCSPEVEGEGTKKVCELVQFMIEHSQQILGEDPSALFGGPPQRPTTEETSSDSWMYPLTDSSYDSLENELDSSGGSPNFCSRRRLCSKPRQGSLDSILTFSDCDQDTDPDVHPAQAASLHGLKLRPLRQQAPDLSCSSQDALTVHTSTLDSLSLDGQHRQRRSSEPAIAYLAKFQPCASGSTAALTGEDDDGKKELSMQPSGHTLAHTDTRSQSRRSGGESKLNLHRGKSAGLKASSSSLSTTPTSPAPVCSSLDTISSDQTWVTRHGLCPAKAHLSSTSGSLSISVPSTPFSISTALTSGGQPDLGTSPEGSPPREPHNWGTLKGCRGLHPNSWLKKDQRLSLTQQDDPEKQEEDTTGGPVDKLLTLVPEKGKADERGGGQLISSSQHKLKTSCRPSKNGGGEHVRNQWHFPKCHWFQSSPLTVHTSTAAALTNQGHGAQSKVSDPKQTGLSLSLFKFYQRRGSEPGRQIVDRGPTHIRARLPSDPGLKVSEVDSQGEERFSLSPCAAKAVRDYFSSHRCSNSQSSQQVALALVKSHREWLKRCSDPTAEPDLDRLLFAEESYV